MVNSTSDSAIMANATATNLVASCLGYNLSWVDMACLRRACELGNFCDDHYYSSQQRYEDELQLERDLNDEIRWHNLMYRIIVPIAMGLIAFFGIFGNSIVIYVLAFNKPMRTTVNLLLLNLAISDLIFDSVSVPLIAYHYAGDQWAIGVIACKLHQFFIYVLLYVNVYTLVLISCLRYMSVVHGPVTAQFRTKRNVCCLIGILWGVCLLGNIPVLLIYQINKLTDPNTNSHPYYYCGLSDPMVGRRLFVTLFILNYLLPLAMICLLYLMVVRHLNINKDRLQRTASKSTANGGGGTAHAHHRTSHATRIVITVVVVFGVCWLPLHVHLLIVYFLDQPQGRPYEVYRLLSHIFAYANSCMNPFIYSYVSKTFRDKVLVMCRVRSPSNHAETQDGDNMHMEDFNLTTANRRVSAKSLALPAKPPSPVDTAVTIKIAQNGAVAHV